jgi:uncharacterized protein
MRVLAALLVALIAACAAPSPRTHYYTLSAESPAAAAEAKGPVVSVWQVAIPEVVDRTQLVVRLEANRVDISDFHRWAEPLRRGVPRALAENLSRQLGRGSIVVAGQPAGITPDVRVSVDIQKFDAALGQSVTVEALWNIRRAGADAATGRSSVTEPARGGDHAAIVAAYSRALARVSQDIAAALTAAP